MEPLLKAEHLTVCYNGVPAVRDVSFQLKEGEILGIVGESGSGKSTILRAVLGLLGKAGRLTQGNIWYRGKNLTELTEKQMRLFRGHWNCISGQQISPLSGADHRRSDL